MFSAIPSPLGSWLNASGNNLNALSLSYFKAAGDSPTTLEFSSMHAATEWVWAHSRTDGDWQQVATMKVDSTHGLTIYDPAQPNRPVIVLDPTGKSHLERQGDLSMGEFTATPH